MKLLTALVSLCWLLLAPLACSQQGYQMPKKTIQAVLKEHTDSLMALPGVVGTAQGECLGEPCIKVFVVKKTPKLLKQIPSVLDEYPVEVQESGEIKARNPA